MMDDEVLASMPASDVRQASKSILQKQLFAILTTPVNGLGPVFAHMEEHLQFQIALEKQGTMFAAGPLWTDDAQAWEGEGMVTIRAESVAAARAIAERDPMHQAGARTFRIRPWMVNEGSMTVRIDFSSQTFDIA
ncbi:MAG: YciI family protein [Candidatus Devosia euplotis]|nr:YciI family protein [Candidatus Devosia euplotis]